MIQLFSKSSLILDIKILFRNDSAFCNNVRLVTNMTVMLLANYTLEYAVYLKASSDDGNKESFTVMEEGILQLVMLKKLLYFNIRSWLEF